MTQIGRTRDQLLLLPEAVDDYVWADNSVRFIDAFVDGLDIYGRPGSRGSKRPEILDRRGEVVEHPFGTIKQ